MKTLFATILSVTLLSAGAYAQPQSSKAAESSSIPHYTNKPTSTKLAAPNRARVYGVNRRGQRVNPDEVPPLSPGGQGLAPEAR